MTERTERRARTLTDDDIDELMRRIDLAFARQMEAIGYDVTTPKAREQIRKDHEFARDLRLGTARAKVAAWGAAISTFVGGALYMLWLTLRTALNAKGAG
jgi:hypothetical protein